MTSLAQKFAGKFLVVDGPDGAGKSTQMRMLADYLTSQGVVLTVTRDPGGTAIGDKIRTILLDKANGSMAATCELMLYMASRAQLLAEVITPALAAGRCVLCDRYVSSTLAYQGAAGVDAAAIMQAAQVAVGNTWPDLTIIIDVPSDFGLGRAGHTGGHDRMESKSLEFHSRVRESFLAQARENPAKFAVVDGRGTPDEVHRRLLQSLERLR